MQVLFVFHVLVSIICFWILMVALTFLRTLAPLPALPLQGCYTSFFCICLCLYCSFQLSFFVICAFRICHTSLCFMFFPKKWTPFYQMPHWFFKLQGFLYYLWFFFPMLPPFIFYADKPYNRPPFIPS